MNKFQNRETAEDRRGQRSSGKYRQKNKKASRSSRASSFKSKVSDRDGRNVFADSNDNSSRISGANDFAWYNHYPLLTETNAAFPYPYRPGMVLDLGTATITKGSTTTTVKSQLPIPGILAIEWVPSVGFSQYATDPASIVGKEMYAKVRSVYSGSIDADAPDFVMYTMALDSVFSYIAWLKRTYRILTAWTPTNFMTPDALFAAASGASVNEQKALASLRKDRTKFLAQINELVYQSRKFKCPAVMDIFNRHYWMNDNVYLDADTLNAQMYVFAPEALYRINPNAAIPGDSSNTAAGLDMVPYPSVYLASSDTRSMADILYEFGLDLIQRLDAWDDAYLISGYLTRAYQDVPSFMVTELQPTETIEPVYLPEVLSQIENCVALNNYKFNTDSDGIYTDLCVVQNPLQNSVVSTPLVTDLTGSSAASNISTFLPGILTVRSDNPTPQENVIASRLQPVVQNISVTHPTTGNKGYKVQCGTEIPLFMRLYSLDINYTTGAYAVNAYSIRSQMVLGLDGTTINTSATIMDSIMQSMQIAAFDWHPMLWLWYSGDVTVSAANNRGYQLFPVGDIHNITTVTADQMAQLHRICLFSEFNSFSL